jgi:HSP20 family molecular chaperone IbpA
MSDKNNQPFDFLENFLAENQNVFLKNYKKNSVEHEWPENLYSSEKGAEDLQREEDGQLAIDVYQKNNEIVILAAIGGLDPEKLDISLHNDILTIRGERKTDEEISEQDYFYKECYWGKFSRSIILPVEIKADEIGATIKNGILKIVLPKANPERKIKLKVLDEE